MIHRLLHLPGSSLEGDTAFLFEAIALPSFRSIKVWSVAILTRAAFVTLPFWQSLISWAYRFGEDYAPLINIIHGDFSPRHWDSIPFVLNFQRIVNGIWYNRVSSADSAQMIKNAVLAARKVQSEIYKIVLPTFYSRSPIALIKKRLAKWASIPHATLDSIDWQEVFSFINNNFTVSARVNIAKTFLAAWTTDRRMQRCVRQCPFCSAPDGHDFLHIIQCDALWLFVSQCFNLDPSFVEEELLGIFPLSKRRLSCVAILFFVFHNAQDETIDIDKFKLLAHEAIRFLRTDNLFRFEVSDDIHSDHNVSVIDPSASS